MRYVLTLIYPVFLFLFLTTGELSAQGVAINITGAHADTSAMLDVSSTVKGLLIPRMTSLQRLAMNPMGLAQKGMLVYDVTADQFFFWDGNVWIMAIGPAGPAGATGAAGLQGLPGATGATGPQGLQGVQGAQGNAGPTGATGPAGPQGVQGNAGATGATGPTGPQGLQGAQGAQGNAGATGATGPTGPQGAQGTQGLQGATGAQGPAGPVGCYSANYLVKSDGSAALCSQGFDNGTNVGIGTTVPASKLHVVADGDNIPIIYGVNSNSSTGTTAFGVRGECGAIGLGSAGVSGVSTNYGQNEIGTLGDYGLWGAGIFGMGWAGAYTDMPASKDFGLFGTVNFSTGTGMYANNTSSGANAIYGVGNQVVTGSKSASVPTSKGNQLLYSMESPEIWFEDIGGGQLTQGEARIEMDPMFLETVFIDASHPYHVFIQPEGECNGLYVKEKGNDYFIVKELQQGTSDTRFSFRIMAKRVNYQDHRFGCDWMQPFEDNRDKATYVKPYKVSPEDTRRWVDEEAGKKNSLKTPSAK